MISIRRYVVYIGLAACILYTLNYFRTDILSHAQSQYGSTVPGTGSKEAPGNSFNGRFDWSTVRVDYPVKSFTPLPTGKPLTLPKVQHDFTPESSEQSKQRQERQAAVLSTFKRSWKAYKEHAWGKDELAPLSGGVKDGFGGWGASLVDNLDNLWIMGLKTEFEEALSEAMKIDLGSATIEKINVFETTIRHLGGFLAAYDLSGDERCLLKAREFGEMLYKAFDTPNHMPITRWIPSAAIKGKQEANNVVLVAEIGSLTMEFTRLSMLTGDPKWYDAVERITRTFAAQQDQTHMPGMWPVVVDAKTPDFTGDTYFTLGAMSDSLYEYFPKMEGLLGGLDPLYKKMYSDSMKAAIKYNLYRPMTPDNADILVSAGARAREANPPQLDSQGQHLVCFAGGMFALGGKIFDVPGHVEIGRKLTDGCIWAYKALPLGIMPEVFNMVPCDSRLDCSWNETLWREHVRRRIKEDVSEAELDGWIKETLRLPKGFTDISDRRYILRPEAIESVFILYRITGDEALRDAAWDMFTAIDETSRTHLANAAMADITVSKEAFKQQPTHMDSMESFWMAETLKYFYLIFSKPDVISLDEWTFNTEAHPFKRALP